MLSTFKAAAHLLWPWSCPLCGVPAVADAGCLVCPACSRAIAVEQPRTWCPCCGGPPRASGSAADPCPSCESHPKAFAAIAVVGHYKGILRQSIVQWKFGRCPGLDLLLGELLSDGVEGQGWSPQVQAIVPVAQPWTRWLTRGFFPVGELADHLGRRLGVPVWPILRARRHRRQVGLGGEQRQKNVRGVYSVRSGVDLGGRTVCLVDDVMTTGATLNAAAAALREAGARQVFAAVVGRAEIG